MENFFHWEPARGVNGIDDVARLVSAQHERLAAVANAARGRLAEAAKAFGLEGRGAMHRSDVVAYVSDGSAPGEGGRPGAAVLALDDMRAALLDPKSPAHHLVGEIGRHGIAGRMLIVEGGHPYFVRMRLPLAAWIHNVAPERNPLEATG